MTEKPSGRGGRRAGAGAPPGNKNAAKTGQRSKDPAFRAFIQSLTPEQLRIVAGSPRKAWLAAKEANQEHGREENSLAVAYERDLLKAELERRSAVKPEADVGADIRSFRPDASIHTPHPTAVNQSKDKSRRGRLIEHLRELRLLGAEGFVDKHWSLIPTMERLLDEIEQLRDSEEGKQIVSFAALFSSSFHKEVGRETADYHFCPFCPWKTAREPGALEGRGMRL